MSQILDPTFYRSPADAIAAPPERLAYVAAYDPAGQAKDAMAVIDCDPSSSDYGRVVGWSELPTAGNELHHFGWNACSSALCHQGHGDHGGPLERRYLIVPGIRSSRIYVLDTKPDPRNPRVVRTIEAEELASKAGYSRPHTIHCGPGGIFVFTLGGANGDDGPGGVALLDHDTFDVIGAWELDRGDQFFGYDGWWHLNHDTVITSEWATPSMFEDGLNPEDMLGRRFGHHLNFWSMSERKLTQRVDLGDQHQMVFEVRPAHDPSKTWGLVGVVISVEDLSGSVWLWHKDGDRWAVRKVLTIPAEPADPEDLPPALKPFGAVPPLISDIDLSVDDRWPYVSCWGTGELKQYDVADPFNPRETGSVTSNDDVRLIGPHPDGPGGGGAPRGGRRLGGHRRGRRPHVPRRGARVRSPAGHGRAGHPAVRMAGHGGGHDAAARNRRGRRHNGPLRPPGLGGADRLGGHHGSGLDRLRDHGADRGRRAAPAGSFLAWAGGPDHSARPRRRRGVPALRPQEAPAGSGPRPVQVAMAARAVLPGQLLGPHACHVRYRHGEPALDGRADRGHDGGTRRGAGARTAGGHAVGLGADRRLCAGCDPTGPVGLIAERRHTRTPGPTGRITPPRRDPPSAALERKSAASPPG